MSTILVVAEQRGGSMKKTAHEALSQARRMADASGGRVVAVIAGSGIKGLAPEAARFGADHVYLADHSDLADYSTEGYTLVAQRAFQMSAADLVLMGASAMGKDMAPRLAARLKLAYLPDVVELTGSGALVSAVRPMYAGKVRVSVQPTDGTRAFVTLRPNVFRPLPVEGRTATTEAVDTAGLSIRARVVDTRAEAAGRVELTEADVIVSGGRGIKGPESFAMIQELADAFGGALGASRAVVDAGWIDHSHQVGQTGKTVSPGLYVACGISGAIQHLAGMSSSKIIVAINKDGEAPIFKVADIGLVGDLFDIIPKLTAEVKRIRAS
ncbi:MAG: electron transfer flavoprotein subunit alpha/FixB family protein [Candidatus Eisenbacteria bacterium]|nr:electron transfer flavoprotein subunit alpha/FixB family protein [Candidatus Eisenbacteria bacterium]